jgi:hypothetical protein
MPFRCDETGGYGAMQISEWSPHNESVSNVPDEAS